jgi:hypothetical protein
MGGAGSAGATADAGIDSSVTSDEGGSPRVDAGVESPPRTDAPKGKPALALAVAVGSKHSCALLSDHRVKCWGANDDGQLGYGDTRTRGQTPEEMGDALPAVALGTGRTAVAISASAAHTCALLDDGSVKCWGEGSALGLPDAASRGIAPGQMGDALPALDLGVGRKAKMLAAGFSASCALLDDASLRCWGTDSSSGSRMQPTRSPLATSRAVTAIGAGELGVFALLDDKTLVPLLGAELPELFPPGDTVTSFAGAFEALCWTTPASGPVGCGAGPEVYLHNEVGFVGLGVTERSFSCGVTFDGHVRCHGPVQSGYWNSGVGLRGTGVEITGKVTALASGGQNHMCALTDDARVWCWGDTSAAIGASTDLVTWGPVDLGTGS